MKTRNPTHLKLALAGLFLLIVLGFLITGKAGDRSEATPEDRPAHSPAKQDYPLGRSLLALALVLGGLTGVNWYLKNRGSHLLGAKAARRLRVIERLAIDQKRCLLLVSLDGRELLVGVGNDQLSVLQGLGNAAPVASETTPEAAS